MKERGERDREREGKDIYRERGERERESSFFLS